MLSLDVAGTVEKIRNFGRRIARLQVEVWVSHLEGANYVKLLSKRYDKVLLCINGSKLHDSNIAGIVGWLRKKKCLCCYIISPNKKPLCSLT